MINTNITNFRKDIFNYVEQTIKFNTPVNVSTKSGNVVLMSDQDYRNLMETIYVESVPGYKESIVESIKSPREEGRRFTGNTFDEFVKFVDEKSENE